MSSAHDGSPDLRSEPVLLATKRAMPRTPPGYLQRTRLFTRLDEATAGAALTLVQGAAGMGKTALVSEWVARGRAPGPVAWLSLHPGDDHRGLFWRQVLLALGEAGGGPALDRLGDASTVSGTVDDMLVALVSALTAQDQPVVLVLDDLHEIASPDLCADLGRLLRVPPPNMRIVATARWEPPLRLARLRMEGGLVEIGSADLAFTEDEAVTLLTSEHAGLAVTDAQRLWARTEGWPAGLALTALSLRGRDDPAAFVDAFAGDVASVSDYLLEEVLEHESEAVRRFLLCTSVLNAVCGDLADALTCEQGGGAMLADLHQRGVLTVSLDEHRQWYRYHGLMGDMLRAVLRREDPDGVPLLHVRAARWLEAHGRPVNAARHAIAAGELDLLGDIALRHAYPLLVSGQYGDMGAALAGVPAGELAGRAPLTLTMAGAALERGDAGIAAQWLERGDAVVEALDPERRQTFDVANAVARLYLARLDGDLSRVAAATLPIIEQTNGLVATHDDLRAMALVHLGAIELWTGQLAVCLEHLDAGTALAEESGSSYLELSGHALAAVALAWSGDLDGGAFRARRALAIAERGGWRHTPQAGTACTVLGYVAACRGDLHDARLMQDEANDALARTAELPLRTHVLLQCARLDRWSGDPTSALTYLAESRAVVAGTPFLDAVVAEMDAEEALALYAQGHTDRAVALLETAIAAGRGGQAIVALARIRLEEGDHGAALALVRPFVDGDALPTIHLAARVHALLVAARAHHRDGDAAASSAALARALALSDEGGRRMPFIEHGDEMQALLAAFDAGGSRSGPFVHELVDRHVAVPAGSTPALMDELSARELAILRYLPTPMSNREIAAELVVSVNTVKTHVKSIYSKLDTHDRRAAVRRARGLGLLSATSRSEFEGA